MAIKIKNRDPKYTDFSANDIVINRKTGTLFFKNEQEIIKIQSASLLDNVNVSDTLTAHSSSFTHITSPDKDIVKHSTSGIAKTTFIKPGIGNVSIENGFTVDNYKINPAFANPAQIGSTFVVGPTLNIKGGIGADNLDVKGRISADSFIGDGSKLTNLPTVSSGGSSSSTGNTEVLTFINAYKTNYDETSGTWIGPTRHSVDGRNWSQNYGDDTGVLTLPSVDFVASGIIVPFACTLLGFQALIVAAEEGTVATTQFAIYKGDFDYANGSSGASSINITSGTAELAVGDILFPRIKHNDTGDSDLFYRINILIKRT